MIFFWGLGFLRGNGSILCCLEDEAKGGKEDATMLNGFFRGGVEEEIGRASCRERVSPRV